MFKELRSRHNVRCLESAEQTAAEYPSRRSVPLHNNDASEASLNLPVSQHVTPMLPKQLLPEVHGVLLHGQLSDSVFACSMPLKNKSGSALDVAPVMVSVLQSDMLSQPGVLIQFSSEISLILLFLRKIIIIFRVPLHFLGI